MSPPLSPLLAPMLSSAAMRAVCDDLAYLQYMLDFEAALARAEALSGIIPAASAEAIAKACKAGAFDLAALAQAATRSGNLAIPLVKALTADVAKTDNEAARYVHWGATSQDVIDTAAMLRLRAGIDALLADTGRASAGFAALARQHRNTPVVARTWLQHALPMPFGLKLAEYAAALHRSRVRLQRLRREAVVLQFGGAAGTLAALGDKGLLVAERLAQELELPLADAPWHTHRDPLAEAAAALPPCRTNAIPSPLRPRWPQRSWRRTWRRRYSRPKYKITSAARGRGMRNGRPCRTCCSSLRVRWPALSISPKAWKSTLRGCGSISTPQTG